MSAGVGVAQGGMVYLTVIGTAMTGRTVSSFTLVQLCSCWSCDGAAGCELIVPSRAEYTWVGL
jgi:hypothetical protein